MSSRRRIVKSVLIVLGLGVLAGGYAVYAHKSGPNHLATVTPGVLYRSGLLRPANLNAVIDEYGIRTVVSLIDVHSERHEIAVQARIVEGRGLTFVDLPMEPETPPTPEQVETWLSLLEDPERRPVLVHCKHGVVRTGMMVAVYLLESGARDNEAVLQGLPMFGHDLNAPYRNRMREFIRTYPPGDRLTDAADR